MADRSVHEFDILAADGSQLRLWQNTVPKSHPTVLLCPGLGALPESWPDLLRPHAPAHVVSWYHRGTFGSSRPPDTRRITLADHVEDALAVLDAVEVERCIVAGWSVGVAVASEIARRHPKRVSGLMLLGGTPGAGFDAMLGNFGVPESLRRLVGVGGTTSLRLLAPVLEIALHRLPVNELSVRLLQNSGFMLPGGDPAAVEAAMRRFLQHDWQWYFTLALALGTSAPVDLGGIRCPLTVVAGRYDLFSDVTSIARSVAALPQTRMRVLPTSHFLPLEAPTELSAELELLLRRVEAVECARLGIEPSVT